MFITHKSILAQYSQAREESPFHSQFSDHQRFAVERPLFSCILRGAIRQQNEIDERFASSSTTLPGRENWVLLEAVSLISHPSRSPAKMQQIHMCVC